MMAQELQGKGAFKNYSDDYLISSGMGQNLWGVIKTTAQKCLKIAFCLSAEL